MRMNLWQTKIPELIQELPLGITKRKPSSIERKAHPVLALALMGLLVLVPICARTQEQGFPMPSATGVLGRKDAGALGEIKAHLLAVSAAGWQALEATGTLTYPDGAAHEATLYLMGANNSRLDIKMEAGTRSFRQSGFAARFQHENGNHGSLPPATAGAGIVAFPRIWTDAVTSSRISLYDHNTSAFNGQNLHRITIEYPIDIGAASGGTNGKTAVTDLYFDPNTHVLAYSVDAVTFNGPTRQTFSRETSYEDYQQFSGIRVPTTIKQYLNGQLQWTLQLSQIAVNAAPAANTFSF
jgi:hypothetical protein